MNFSIEYSSIPSIVSGLSQVGDHETVRKMVKELTVEIENNQIEIQNLKNTIGNRRQVISVGCDGIKETAFAALQHFGFDTAFEDLSIEKEQESESKNLYVMFVHELDQKFQVVVKEVPGGWYCDYVKKIG